MSSLTRLFSSWVLDAGKGGDRVKRFEDMKLTRIRQMLHTKSAYFFLCLSFLARTIDIPLIAPRPTFHYSGLYLYFIYIVYIGKALRHHEQQNSLQKSEREQ